MYCPKCDHQNPDDAVYCCACGFKMHWIGYTIHCPYCGWENNRKRATYCAKCGKSLPTLKGDIAILDDAAPIVHCLYCNATYRGNFSFCYDCGHALGEVERADALLSEAARVSTQIVEATPKASSVARTKRPGYIQCPHCGGWVAAPGPDRYPRRLWLRVVIIFYALAFMTCISLLLLLAILTTPAG